MEQLRTVAWLSRVPGRGTGPQLAIDARRIRTVLIRGSSGVDLNHLAKLEDGQVHGNHQATDQDTQHRHDDRLHQRG